MADKVYELAKRLVEREVINCVSTLVSTLLKTAYQENALIDEDDAHKMWSRRAHADDYRDAAPADLDVTKADDGTWTAHARGEVFGASYATEREAWCALFDAEGEQEPDGGEVFEHWIVSDWLADKLEEQGESVARDVQGLTIWGRCTTGQAIALDYVIQSIARAAYGAES